MQMPWAVVIACCVGMFAATASGSSRAPFLLDMAGDLNVTLPAIANLFGVTSVCWGLSAYVAGLGSDRFGRGPFLLGAPIMLALSLVAMSLVYDYWLLVACVAIAGIGCGAFTATSMAEVSLRTESNQRGRALGWVMGGQSLTLLIGVPLSAWLGAIIGWRGVHVGIAVIAVFATILVAFSVRKPSRSSVSAPVIDAPRTTLGQALTGPITRLFIALIMERICFGLSAFYYAAFLRTSYTLEIEAVALPLAGFAVGNIVGTVLGGQLADKFPYRRVSFAVCMFIAGGFALAWFMWTPGLLITIAIGVGFSLFDALSRPSLMAALADVPVDVRGVIMGLNTSIASIGWLIAALVGGWLYAGIGFASFGPIMATMCVTAGLLVLRDSRIRQHVTPAS